MAEKIPCAILCRACGAGDKKSCQLVDSPPCDRSCPSWLRSMETLIGDPVESSLREFISSWKDNTPPGKKKSDRDSRNMRYTSAKARGREAMVPVPLTNRVDIWGGGLRRMSLGDVGPRREDYYAPRYVPIGFARYQNPSVDPSDYLYYQLSGWRVAVPRTVPGPAVRSLLMRIYQYGPGSSGYARLGDTLVPAILGPGDRQTLAQTDTRYGSFGRKYPLG